MVTSTKYKHMNRPQISKKMRESLKSELVTDSLASIYKVIAANKQKIP